jgi:hypothetical protein
MTEWQPIQTAPEDGTPILATLRVFAAQDKRFLRWETHIIWFDDDGHGVHDDAYQGWDWGSYEFWQALPAPPQT